MVLEQRVPDEGDDVEDRVRHDERHDPLGAPEEVEVVGAERTTFYPAIQALAQTFRLSIRPDSQPEAGHYYRSDQFSLAQAGIPAFAINEGIKYKGHDVAWGQKQADEFTAKHYHQPSDTPATLDYAFLRRVTQLLIATVLDAAR